MKLSRAEAVLYIWLRALLVLAQAGRASFASACSSSQIEIGADIGTFLHETG